MKTEAKAVELRVLTADEGHLLRRKDATDPVHFSPVVYLGVGDSADNYEEVTEVEAAAYTAALEAEANPDNITDNETSES